MSSPRIYANGLNLGGVSYWNDDRPLIDCWRLHSTSLSSKGKYDPATGLPTGEDTQEVYAMLPVDVGGSFSYQYLINGPMLKIRHAGGPSVTPDASGNWPSFQITRAVNQTGDVQNVMSSSGPIKSLSLIRTDHLAAYNRGEIFNPDLVSLCRGFSPLRFLDWNVTNSTTASARRPLPSDPYFSGYTTGGLPAEYAGQLCSLVGADCWYPCHHLWDDARVLETLHALDQSLAPGLKVILEWSNEFGWNYQAAWAKTQALARYPLIPNGTGGMKNSVPNPVQRYYGYRAGLLAKLAMQVSTTRFKVTLADQWVAGGKRLPDIIAGWDESGAPRNLIDSHSSAPYYYMPRSDITILQGYQASNSIAGVISYFTAAQQKYAGLFADSVKRAAAYGLEYKVYEHNQSLYAAAPTIIDQVTRDAFVNWIRPIMFSEDMANITMKNLQDFWNAGGTTACFFNSSGYGSQNGFWGATRHVADPVGYPILGKLRAQNLRAWSQDVGTLLQRRPASAPNIL